MPIRDWNIPQPERWGGGVLRLLSAYKGLKLVLPDPPEPEEEGLLSAYKGLKLKAIEENTGMGVEFIKCL